MFKWNCDVAGSALNTKRLMTLYREEEYNRRKLIFIQES